MRCCSGGSGTRGQRHDQESNHHVTTLMASRGPGPEDFLEGAVVGVREAARNAMRDYTV